MKKILLIVLLLALIGSIGLAELYREQGQYAKAIREKQKPGPEKGE